MFWDGDTTIRLDRNDGTIHIDSRIPSQCKSIPLDERFKGPGGTNFDYHDRTYWATRYIVDANNAPVVEIYSSEDAKAWKQVGTMPAKDPHGQVSHLFHLGGDTYLLVAIIAFKDGDDISPLATAKRDEKGQIRFASLIPANLGDHLFTQLSKDDWGVKPELMFNVLLGIGKPMARSDRGLLITSARSGYAWIVSENAGSVKAKLGKLIPDLVLKADTNLETAILGAQPRANGHFLVASRTKDAVLLGMQDVALFPAMNRPPAEDNPEHPAITEKLQQNSAFRFPGVLWWDLDPESGQFHQENAPKGAITSVNSADDIHRFAFHLTLDESVKMDN